MNEFKKYTLKDLHNIASIKKIKNHSTLNKNELVRELAKIYDLNKLQSGYKINPKTGRLILKDKSRKNQWLLFTRDGCPYCSKAKELLKSKDINYTEHDIFTPPELKDHVKKMIMEQTGVDYNTVPMIFKSNKFIGGYDNLVNILS